MAEKTNITESRLIYIQDKIITIKDLKKLSEFVFTEFKHKKKPDDYARGARFSVTCDDKSVFSSEHPSLFDENSPLSTKRVLSADISLDLYKPDIHIEINIKHSDDNYFLLRNLYGNKIEVKGNDSKWVNGILRNLEEIVDSFTPQNTTIRKYKKLLSTIFALSIGTIFFRIFILIFSAVPPSPEPTSGLSYLLIELVKQYPFLGYVIFYFLNWMVGYFPADFLINKLQSLWPSVEFQIGPEHKFAEKKRRQWLINAFVVGVLPLALSLLYDILKTIIHITGG